MDMNEWADTHGEPRMTMDQFEQEERAYQEYMLDIGACPDCGAVLTADMTCDHCGKEW